MRASTTQRRFARTWRGCCPEALGAAGHLAGAGALQPTRWARQGQRGTRAPVRRDLQPRVVRRVQREGAAGNEGPHGGARRARARRRCLAVMGRRGLPYFRYHDQPVADRRPGHRMRTSRSRASTRSRRRSSTRFTAREFDAVEIVSTRYRTQGRAGGARRALPALHRTACPCRQRRCPDRVHGARRRPHGRAGADGMKPLYLVEPGSRRGARRRSCRCW